MVKLYRFVSRYLIHTLISLGVIWYTYILHDLRTRSNRYTPLEILLIIITVGLIIVTIITIIAKKYQVDFLMIKFCFSESIVILLFFQLLGAELFELLIDSTWKYLIILFVSILLFISIFIESRTNETLIQLSFNSILIKGFIVILLPLTAIIFSTLIFFGYLAGWFME